MKTVPNLRNCLWLTAGGFRRICLNASLLVSAAAGFGIETPKGWQSQFNLPSGVVLQSISPDTGTGFRANLLATRGSLPCCREEATSLDSLISQVHIQQARVLPLFKVLEKGKRKIGGRNGGFMVSTYAKGEKDLACMQFFYLDGKDFVNVVYTCLQKDLPRLRPEFEKSLATLKTAADETGKAGSSRSPGTGP